VSKSVNVNNNVTLNSKINRAKRMLSKLYHVVTVTTNSVQIAQIAIATKAYSMSSKLR